jgi:hypothetical protein
MDHVEEYLPIMDFTMGKLLCAGNLPIVKSMIGSVGDVLAQVRKVMPVWDKEANVLKTGGVQTGICGGVQKARGCPQQGRICAKGFWRVSGLILDSALTDSKGSPVASQGDLFLNLYT